MKIRITLQHNKYRHGNTVWPLQRCPINVSEVKKHFSLKQGSTNFQKCWCDLQIVHIRRVTTSIQRSDRFVTWCSIQSIVTWDCGPRPVAQYNLYSHFCYTNFRLTCSKQIPVFSTYFLVCSISRVLLYKQ